MKKILLISLFVGLTTISYAVLVDDFESYSTGQVDVVTTSWKSNTTDNDTLIKEDPADASNQVISTTEQGELTGTYCILSSDAHIGATKTKTLFMRFRISNAGTDQSFGMTDVNTPATGASGGWEDFRAQFRLYNGNLDARDGSGFKTLTALNTDTWYNLWMVVNNFSDYIMLYLSTSPDVTEDDLLTYSGSQSTFAFRYSNSEVLDRIYWRVNVSSPSDEVYIDDINITDGQLFDVNLPDPCLVSYWPLEADEYSDDYYLDIKSDHNALVTGTPVFVDGVSGIEDTAVEITPQNGWATSPNFELTSTDEFSISIWGNWQGPVSGDANDLLATTALSGITYLGGIADYIGHWRHLCITYDGLQGRMYLNGQKVYEQYWPVVDLGDLHVQFGHNDGGEFFNGAIDEIKLYDLAISDTQVGDLYYRSEDCILSYADSSDIAGPYGAPDCLINFYDYTDVTDIEELAALADGWLSCGLYPDCD